MRPVRSFVLRQGRLTKGQQHALDTLWPLYGVDVEQGVLEPESLFHHEIKPGCQSELVLEIGFGDGVSLAEMARQFPQNRYIGVEVHQPGIGRLLHLVHENKLNNVRVMNADAVNVLKSCIPPASLDRVQLFFPDPWHKKRHHKRRIVQSEFVELVASRLKKGGVFHLATDWQNYAEHMATVLLASGDFDSLADGPFYPRPAERPVTKFENRGQRLGHGVWDLIFQKK